MSVIKRFLLTLSYVTSLPLKVNVGENETSEKDSLAGLAKYLPSAGLLIGGLLIAIAALLTYKLNAPQIVTGSVLTIAWLCLTGGLHFDGLMDAADGIFSHRNRERMLEIMLDSRVGNFGAMSGMAVLILKWAALTSLAQNPLLLLVSLVLAPAWARWCELYAIGRFPYARIQGKGKVWHDSTRFPSDLMLGMTPVLLVSAAAAGSIGLQTILPIIAFALASGLCASHWLASHIKGHTGDTYGAVVELSETGCLILTAMIVL